MSTQTTDQRHAVASARIDARGPQFAAALTASCWSPCCSLPTPGRDRADRRPGGAVRGRGAGRGAAHAVRLAVPPLRPAPARGTDRVRGPAAAALRAGGRARSSRWSAFVGFADRRAPARPGRRPASRWSAALLNALFRFCLGCEIYLLIKRVPPPDRTSSRGPTERHHMSRDTTLVSAHWVEENLDNDKVVLVEVDEDTSAYDKGHIRGAIKLDWTTDLQDQVRRDFVNQRAVRGAAVRARGRQRRHRRPLRRQQQLVRRLRLLVLQALRPRGRQAPRRRPQEVGARLPRADRRAARSASRRRTRPRSRTSRSAPSATRPSRPSAPRTWSTSAAPTSTPAGCSPRPTCRRSRRSAPVTSRPRPTCRGARRPTTTAPSSPTTS